MIEDVLKSYKCNLTKPILTVSGMTSYEAEHKQSKQMFTVKIYKKPPPQIITYLTKIKSLSNDYIIKINDIVNDSQSGRLMVIQEHVPYGNLKKALVKCKRLEDQDAIYISKLLLNGHMELLRGGVFWFGDQSDIQFTENGMKLSWNNSMPFSQMINPFPDIIGRIAIRPSQINGLIPFPTNKMIADLIKVSRENASEMSLHPLLKKRDKIMKKKGKGWFGLKESKIKGQYFLQLSYLAVSNEHGFVRVKFAEIGKVDPEILKIHQNKTSFVRIIQYYQQNGSWITISDYANDGTIQSYVKRLKNSNISLKQTQIEFFFYSLIEPLKYVHRNNYSINMLNIRNIFIENGIPKIGQPVPLTQVLSETLQQRCDVPDFYHKEFKASPEAQKNPTFDTYSLGVLLYKLMYTEYPIFPQGKVHIPTTPAYKKQLKQTLQLFLNVGGSIEELERQIQISDDVKNQIKENQKILDNGNKAIRKEKVIKAFNEDFQQIKIDEKKQLIQQNSKKSSQCTRLYKWLTNRGKDTDRDYENLYKSNYSANRKCFTITLITLFYLLVFFLFYITGLIQLFAHTKLFSQVKVNILGSYTTVVTPNYDNFMNAYSAAKNDTLGNRVISEVLMCKIDNKGVYYDFIRPQSPHWYIFLLLSLFTMIIILVVKGILISKFSTATVGYYYYNDTIQARNQSRFALSSYIYSQLWFSMTLFCFYTTFNYIYNEQHLPCFGGSKWTAMTTSLFTNRIKFVTNYLPPIIGCFIFSILSFLQCTVFYSKINYDKLINPIFIFTPFYIGLFILIRLGAFRAFYPSFLNNEPKIILTSYMDIVGYFPEILVVLETLICYTTDYIFLKCVDPKIERFMIDNSVEEISYNDK